MKIKWYDVCNQFSNPQKVMKMFADTILALSTDMFEIPQPPNDPDVVVHFTFTVLSIQFVSRYRASTTVGTI